MPEPVVHDVPMRWADLDSLDHVNNVVYLDYAAEARALLEGTMVGADEPVARIAVDFLRPLLLSSRPVQVASTRDGADLVQEIRSEGSDVVFARVTTSFGDRASIEPAGGSAEVLPSRVRRSDLDQTGSVSTTKLFELFQDARVLYLARRLSRVSPGRFVVGHAAVTYALPLSWRPEPYGARSWVSRVGGSSLTVESQLVDGDRVVAQCTTVLVGFDLEAQSSRRLTDEERAELDSLRLRS